MNNVKGDDNDDDEKQPRLPLRSGVAGTVPVRPMGGPPSIKLSARRDTLSSGEHSMAANTSMKKGGLFKRHGERQSRYLQRKIAGHDALLGDADVNHIPDELVPAAIRPGAVAVGVTKSEDDDEYPPHQMMIRDGVTVYPMLLEDDQIIAHLAATNEPRIAEIVEERLRKHKGSEIIVAAEEVKYTSSTFCGLQRRTFMWILAILLVLVIVSVVSGVVSSLNGNNDRIPSPGASSAPVSLDDPLLEELRSVNALSDDDLALFDDPMSPQSKSLAWLKNDAIVMSSSRSTQDVLQRYVLAVLFFATSRPNWTWSYMSSNDDACTWNNGTEHRHGVYCQLDGVSIDELILDKNNLQGSLPWEMVLLTNLEILDLSDNRLSGFIPTRISELTLLRTIDVSTNNLRGLLPTTFSSVTVAINLTSNKFVGTIPQAWGTNMPNLKYLDLQVNDLTGALPTTLGQLSSLYSLGLHSNYLNGPIPSELGRMRSLTHFKIGHNELKGTIPSELGQMLSLDHLAIDTNKLTGTIPSELGELVLLANLDIAFNELTGTIPSEFGRLVSLNMLGISENQLSGTIPSELGRTPLEFFDLARNSITGTVDELFCTGNRSVDCWLAADCDEVDCDCCKRCCADGEPFCRDL
jgi:hypothetical protein